MLAGVAMLEVARRYRAGSSPALGRHRFHEHLWTWYRNAIFAAAPLGVILICSGVIPALGHTPPTWAVAIPSVIGVAAVMALLIMVRRPPRWSLPEAERRHELDAGR
jgi:hypothetical protein